MNNVLALAPYLQQASGIFQNAQASVPQLQAIFTALQSGAGANVADTVSKGLTSLFNAASAGPTLPNGAPNPVSKTLLTDLYRASSILNETCTAFSGTLSIGSLSVPIPPQLCQFATNARSTLQTNLKNQGVDLSAIDAEVDKVKSFMQNKSTNAPAPATDGAAAAAGTNLLDGAGAKDKADGPASTPPAEPWPWWKYVVFIALPLLVIVALVYAITYAAKKNKKTTTTTTRSVEAATTGGERANLLSVTSETSSP